MFKKNPDGMRMEPTPERVLSVCRLVAQKRVTRDEIRDILTLGKVGDKELDEIDKSIVVASEELGVIKMKDNYFELAVSKEIISSTVAFRRFVASKVFAQSDTTFSMFSKWIIDQNDRLFSLEKWEVMAVTSGADNSELSAVDENAVLGWRFWAAFLGLGYLNRTMFLPNMKIRLQDIFATSYPQRFKYGETIRATEFIDWLSSKLPEVSFSNRLPLAVSAGFRTLHELGLIKLETWRDSNRVMLFFVDGDPINDFSHITVSEEVCK